MKGKTLGFLLIAALVLGGLGYLAGKRDEASFTQSKLGMGGKVLADFDPNTVAAIHITAATNHLHVAKKGDAWVVSERGDYPANFATISEFLRKLADLKVARPVEAGPSRFAALDLVEPDKGPGVRVELLGTDGKPVQTLLLGRKHVRGGEDNSPMGGGGGYPDGRYVMVGATAKSVALVSDALAGAEPRAEDWLNKDFLKVELPKNIEVIHLEPTNSFRLSRTNEFGEWQLADLKGEEKLDTSKAGIFGSVLSSPAFNDVLVNPDLVALGLDKPTVAKITTSSGLTYEVRLGRPQANEDYPVQVAVTGVFPEPPKDEKPEDKEKRMKLQEKLKAEQAFAKSTFLISKWTVDPLLKKRGELLADKKAEAPKPADAGNGLPAGLNLQDLQGIPGLPKN